MAGADFDDSHWRSAGERIQALIEACASDTPAAQAAPSSWYARSSSCTGPR